MDVVRAAYALNPASFILTGEAEHAFWYFRVASVLLTGSISTPDYSDLVFNDVIGKGSPGDEQDVYETGAYMAIGLSIPYDTDPPTSLGSSALVTGAVYRPPFPALGANLLGNAGMAISGYPGLFAYGTSSSGLMTAAVFNLVGSDPITGNNYSYSFPFYDANFPTPGPGISGSVTATALTFHEWKNADGDPLYDINTGDFI